MAVDLDPVAGVGDALDADVRHPPFEAAGEVDAEVAIPLAPDQQRRAGDRRRWLHRLARVAAEEGAIVVERGGERAGAAEGALVTRDVLLAEGAGADRLRAKRVLEQGVAAGTEDGLGQPGKLEEEHVRGSQQLRRVAQLASEGRRVGGVEDDQLVDRRRVAHRQVPGDAAAPVVSGDDRAPFAEVVDQAGDVVRQGFDHVAAHTRRLRRGVIAAHVRSDDAVAGRGQRRDLISPGVPELGEAVQQDDERAGAGFDVVQPHTVHDRLAVQHGFRLRACLWHRTASWSIGPRPLVERTFT
jgi:hypothetical protein